MTRRRGDSPHYGLDLAREGQRTLLLSGVMYTSRPAESGDFDPLFAIYGHSRRCRAQASEVAWDPVEARRSFGGIFRECDVQVIEAGGQLVGYIAVDEHVDPVELRGIEIVPAVRGRGWGTRLVMDLIRQARRRDRDVAVQLEHTDVAWRLFARLGFERIEEDEAHFTMRWSGTPGAREALQRAGAPWEEPARAGAWLAHLFEDPSALIAFVMFAMNRAELPKAPRILDVGCGHGLRLAAWASLGGEVTGLASYGSAAVAAARQAALLGPKVRVTPGSAADLGESRLYDLALLADGELGRALTHAERRRAAQHLRAALKPGAAVVVTALNWPVILSRGGVDPQPVTVAGPLATVSRIPRYEFDFHEGQVLIRKTDVVERDGQEVAVVEHEDRQALLTRADWVELLSGAGFVAIETFADLESTAVGRAIRSEIVLLARVPRGAVSHTRDEGAA